MPVTCTVNEQPYASFIDSVKVLFESPDCVIVYLVTNVKNPNDGGSCGHTISLYDTDDVKLGCDIEFHGLPFRESDSSVWTSMCKYDVIVTIFRRDLYSGPSIYES